MSGPGNGCQGEEAGAKSNGTEDTGVRRRSRWGSDRTDGEGDGEGTRKRSRWGGKDETAGVAGMSPGAALLVQQNPQLIKIQLRLNEIQRLQALPRLLGGLMIFPAASVATQLIFFTYHFSAYILIF
jgi:hypothetical protein